jgi:hypothetical protein
MIALNGFSERAAAPLFLGFGAFMSAVNVGAVAAVTAMMTRADPDASRRRRRAVIHGVVFTALPFLAAAAFFLGGGSI